MSDDRELTPSCASCAPVWGKLGKTSCWSADPASAPPRPGRCPSTTNADLCADGLGQLRGEGDDARTARVAAQVEGLCYARTPGSDTVHARWTRVEDTVAFARLMGYRKIGIATCIGLLAESEALAEILRTNALEPVSVCCKAGSVDKAELGVAESDKVRPGTFEPACNPVAQAEILNRAATELNLIVGLCVGHDILFTRHSRAPVSTLVVKDRVTGHNPAAALYGQAFYYRRLQKVPIAVPATRTADPLAPER
jgi:uncharacterized metal-binding protein